MSPLRKASRVQRLAALVTSAYPNRYPRIVVMSDSWVFAAFDDNPTFSGPKFTTWLNLESPSEWPRLIERARVDANANGTNQEALVHTLQSLPAARR